MLFSVKREESTLAMEEEEGSSERGFEQRVLERELRREVHAVIKLMAKSSKTPKSYATEKDFVELFKKRRDKAPSRKQRLEIIQAASEEMRETIGVEIVRDEKRSPARFYLRQLRLDEVGDAVKEVVMQRNDAKTDEEHYKDGLLYAALMHIFMQKKHSADNRRGVSRRSLQRFLATTSHLTPDGFVKFFGPVKTALFLAQGFLRYDPETSCYDWGSRADAVVNKAEVLCRFCDIHGSRLYNWPRHAIAAGIDEETLEEIKGEAQRDGRGH